MEQQRMALIPEGLVAALHSFLIEQPYKEVEQMVAGLREVKLVDQSPEAGPVVDGK